MAKAKLSALMYQSDPMFSHIEPSTPSPLIKRNDTKKVRQRQGLGVRVDVSNIKHFNARNAGKAEPSQHPTRTYSKRI